MLRVLNIALLLRGAAAARSAVSADAQALSIEDFEDDKPQGNHTFEDCHCAYSSGAKQNCCHAKDQYKDRETKKALGQFGMGTGPICGRQDDRTCGGDDPVCCTSKVAGSVCCPKGSSCSTSCRGDGGSQRRDGGLCRCQLGPKDNEAQDVMRFPVLKMFAHISQAAYCGPDFYSPWWHNLSKWECREECADAGLRFKPGSIRRVTREDGKTHNATFAYVAVFEDAGNGKQQGPDAPKAGDCVVSVAGSINLQNWKRNFQAMRKRSHTILANINITDKKVKFHMGFQKIWETLTANETEGGVIYELNKLGCGPGSGRSVFPTGQSLGAGVSSIALMDLQERGFKAGMTYIFNAPRMGNKFTMKLYRTAFGRRVPLFRMTHGKDPINRLPPSAAGFRHVGAEVYFPPNWDDKKLEYVVCLKEEDKACAKRYSMVRTLAGGDDHCVNPLVANGNICQLPDFCQDPENPMLK